MKREDGDELNHQLYAKNAVIVDLTRRSHATTFQKKTPESLTSHKDLLPPDQSSISITPPHSWTRCHRLYGNLQKGHIIAVQKPTSLAGWSTIPITTAKNTIKRPSPQPSLSLSLSWTLQHCTTCTRLSRARLFCFFVIYL